MAIDEDYGIWTNKEGLLTIGKKWDDPHKSVVSLGENSQCKGFNSFWWQNWNTWWRLQSWLKTSEIDKNSHKATASCYKEPVIFLDSYKLVPLFSKQRGYISPLVPINYLYDYRIKQFLFSRWGSPVPKNTFQLNNYSDWQRLWGIG